jgi:hypothetical protein
MLPGTKRYTQTSENLIVLGISDCLITKSFERGFGGMVPHLWLVLPLNKLQLWQTQRLSSLPNELQQFAQSLEHTLALGCQLENLTNVEGGMRIIEETCAAVDDAANIIKSAGAHDPGFYLIPLIPLYQFNITSAI